MEKKVKDNSVYWFIGTGLVIGGLATVLTKFGNPANMGLCAACFIRDLAGGLGLDGAAPVQYLRPEIAGFLLGAFILSFARREWKSVGGSASLSRFFTAFFVMIGALVFLGCPLRLMLRLGGGDLNAVIGLIGFGAGVGGGSLLIRRGFSFGKTEQQKTSNGFIMPVLALALLAFLVIRPAFIHFSESGPGSMHAPVLISLVAALIVGALVQRSGLCMSGSIRNIFLIRKPGMFVGYAAIFIAALIGNLILGKFNLGFAGQPIAHTDFIFNFLGMALVGYGSVLLGGCPLRQLVMAGEGNADAGISILGFLVAGATAHNFGIAASPTGVPLNGKIAVVIGFVVITLIVMSSNKKTAVA
ncbi:MAG: YedE-related selenium metabolism membrane protein [Spirochaetaceae bacterium]|jgi:YedE family putative selenium metabolism protein|nr:YedE-related selenium metabolism membrane protein [Spirochaetaceae bacterium]